MSLLLPLVLVAPLAAAALAAVRDERLAGRLSTAAAGAVLALAVALAWRVLATGPVLARGAWLHADALAALCALLVGVVGLAAAAYAARYMPWVARRQSEPSFSAGRFHALFQLLLGALVLAAVANNLGLLWIAIEAGTLVSAVLVGYYRRPGAVEAGWKFLLLGSVGITLALLATVLLYYSAVAGFGQGAAGLQWTALREVAPTLDPRFVRLAFLFALVGYGTKAGIAPMHTWMPDAYGQAPTPVSALLAGGSGAVSLAAVLRFHAIAVRAGDPAQADGLLVVFGLLSMAVAVPFVLVQGDYKRLLAWSSLENTGLVLVALGAGTPLGAFAGLLHLANQSLAKALAYLAGGSLSAIHEGRRMDHWGGAMAAAPPAGAAFAVAGAAIAALPPTAGFPSLALALAATFGAGRGAAGGAALALLVTAFAGLAFHWTRVLLGAPRGAARDPLTLGARVPVWGLAGLVLLLGVWLPSPWRRLVEQAAAVLRP
uniref:Hydrogenase n=1 Tax=Eiseniibacteriota bacterium TaxID=2212470 RepID=A0A832I6V8_UNCEI